VDRDLETSGCKSFPPSLGFIRISDIICARFFGDKLRRISVILLGERSTGKGSFGG
jgi:hypothetical protein